MELLGIYFGHYKTHGLFIYLKSKQYSTCLKKKTIYIAIQQEILLKPFGSSICNVVKNIVAFLFWYFSIIILKKCTFIKYYLSIQFERILLLPKPFRNFQSSQEQEPLYNTDFTKLQFKSLYKTVCNSSQYFYRIFKYLQLTVIPI